MKNKLIILVCIIFFVLNIKAQITPPEYTTDVYGADYINTHSLNRSSENISPKAAGITSYTMGLSSIPTKFTIDKAKSIGEIPVQHSMNNGALNYIVPIELYSGGSNLQPEISLTYNSFLKNGIAGYGWNIGGLSSISVVNKNQYFDGSTAESKLNKDGAYALDGNRLIKIKEESDHITYETEQGNIKVIGYLRGNNIFKYFEAKYPNGQKAIYGLSNLPTGELSYPLMKIENLQGEYIEYNYDKQNNLYYVSDISFSSKKGGIGRIAFTYSNHSSVRTIYTNGIAIKQDRILKSITTYFSGKKLKTYTLTHDNTEALVLKKIDCSNDKNEYLNPLIFYYGDEDSKSSLSFSSKECSTVNGITLRPNHKIEDIPMLKGQFGLNTTGLLIFPAPGSPYGFSQGYRTELFGSTIIKNNKNTDIEMFVFYDASNGIGNHIKVEEGWIDALLTDVDGDGFDELIKVNTDNCKWANGDGYETVTYTSYNINSERNYNEKNKFSIRYKESYSKKTERGWIRNPIQRKHIAGNFLGDGKSQVLSITINQDYTGGYHQSQLNMVCFDSKKSILTTAYFSLNPDDILSVIDYDGDGKAELMRISTDRNLLDIYSFDKSSEGVVQISKMIPTYELTPPNSGKLKPSEILFGDLNGDGKTDILVKPLNGGIVWTAYYSTNNNARFEKKTFPICEFKDGMYFYLQDVNRDGIVDLIKCIGYKTFFCFEGKKDGTISNKQEHVLSLTESSKFIPNNIFQNNQLHQLLGVKSKKIVHITSNQDKAKDYLLTGCINSLGVINKHAYANTTDKRTDIYKQGGSLSYPYNPMRGDMYLLQNSYTYLDNKLISSYKYKYKGGVIDITGKGFLAYEMVTSVDNIRNYTTVQMYDYKNWGVLKSVDSPFSSASYTYVKTVNKNKTARISMINKTEVDKLKNFTVKESYTYDNTYGTLLTQTTDYGNNIKTIVNNKYNNHNTTSLYLLGELSEQITINWDIQESVVAKKIFGYNTQRQVESRKEYYNDNLLVEKKFVYDPKNYALTEELVKKYSSTDWLSTKYNYNDKGLISSKINALGHAVNNTYDEYGRINSIKDYIGNKTQYEYDTWGRVSKVINSDGSSVTSSSSWISSPINALYMTTRSGTNAVTTYSYFDALGRKIRTGEKRFDNSILYTDNVYDEKGRLKKTSLPFKTSPNQWNTYIYDKYNRITSFTSPSGKEETYYYRNATITSSIDGITSSKVYNILGQLEEATDEGGKIEYKYAIDGQLISSKAGNAETIIEYDKYGRQSEIIDPSAGTRIFDYDIYGNINKEIDSNGNIIDYVYDKFGRLLKKTVTTKGNGSLTTNYSYNFHGLIQKVSGSNNTVKDYTYDRLLRLSSERETIIDNKWLQKDYTYSTGNLSSVTYTSQNETIGTENYTYKNGYLVETKLGNISIWKLDEENALGLPTKATTGKIVRNYGYNTYGLLETRQAIHGSTTIQNFKYKFNVQEANLTSRVDVKHKKTEVFAYDPLNRLSNNINYDSIGNIIVRDTDLDFNGVKIGDLFTDYDIYKLGKVLPSENTHIPLRSQKIEYNGLMRPGSITENGYVATFTYDIDGAKIKMLLKKNNTTHLTRYYIGRQYEMESGIRGNKERLYLNGDAYSASSVYVKEGNSWNLYYICRDYLGSITQIADVNGLKHEYSYTPWGRLRNPSTQTVYELDKEPTLFLGRGYTGHEHLPWFGLINMNARLYDPLLMRFLSPDPFVSAPDFSQSFNRYSYALNNPLKYTDPNGEFIIPFLAGLTFGYIANGYHTGDWGWNSIGAGAFVGTGMGTAYKFTGGGNPWVYSGMTMSSMALSNVNWKPSWGDWSLKVNPFVMITRGISAGAGGGYYGGGGISLLYENGDDYFSLDFAGGFRNNFSNFEGRGSIGGAYKGLSYHYNQYWGGGSQATGTAGIKSGKFSMRWENDILAFRGQDQFRSNATEFGWGDYFIGTNVYTTNPYKKLTNLIKHGEDNNASRIFNNTNGSYSKGHQLSSPLYVGMKTKNGIMRIGHNMSAYGDFFQNGFHHLGTHALGLKSLPNFKVGSPNFQLGDYNSLYYQTAPYWRGMLY